MIIRPFLLALAVAAGCQVPPPSTSSDAMVADAGVTDTIDAPAAGLATKTIYSYVDERGHIRMASSIDAIPERHRDQVISTDTGRARSERLTSDRVLVLDLRRSEQGKALNYSVVDLSRLARGTQAVEAAPRDPAGLGRHLARKGADGLLSVLGLKPTRSAPRVILYSAPWCGFCKKAAAHLRKKGVTFIERDIEASRAAAVELERKLRAAGLVGGGIPVLDVGGTLVVGFNQARIDALLDDG